MKLKTYSRAWRLRARLVAIDDVPLLISGGVTFIQIGVFVTALLLSIGLNSIVHYTAVVDVVGLKVVMVLGLPVFLAWVVDRPLKNDKSAIELSVSWLRRRVLEPKTLSRLSASYGPCTLNVGAVIWRPRRVRDERKQQA